MTKNENNRTLSGVYTPDDIQDLLCIGRSSAYTLLEDYCKNGGPFLVLKIGKLYRIPKSPFDRWLNGE
ncbi:MAG: helix-turn-helix domain-containing protein [Ruthenibacterium sp.]